MAQHIRYITKRDNGIYCYHRRVPKWVIENPQAFAMHFGSRPLFRKSLGTRRQDEALTAGDKIHKWFEDKLRSAGGGRIVPLGPAHATRRLTPELLSKISVEARDRTVRPWARQVVLAEQGKEHHDALDWLAHQRELDASELSAVLRNYADSNDPRMPKIKELVKAIVEREHIDAPDLTNNAK